MIRCVHFAWRLTNRDGTWYADGRSNPVNAGRHSLGTGDKAEALQRLVKLDRQCAEDLGLVTRTAPNAEPASVLSLAEGRKRYEQHLRRPRVAGGVKDATYKRYRAPLDKFLAFAPSKGVTAWNGVTECLLMAYIANLETKGYFGKTLLNEITVLQGCLKWLIEAGHLPGKQPIKLKLRNVESEPAYCYRSEEIRAIVEHCRQAQDLKWLGDVIVALACTGLRISELVDLRWTDLDLATGMLTLTDESERAHVDSKRRRTLKSGRSRAFPIHPDLLNVLRRLTKRDGYVFRSPRGGRLKSDTVRRIFVRDVINPLADRFPASAGEKSFKDGRLHSFRHAFCSRCANSGVVDRMVMAWLGHTNSAMIKTYYHLHDDESQRTMQQLDFLGGAGGRSDCTDQPK